jgi:hypothetical protein
MVNPNTIRYLNQYVNSSLLTTGGLITENKMARAMKLLLSLVCGKRNTVVNVCG